MASKVSVILPTFNGASRGYFEQSAKSVLAQTYQDIELLIIDDGSGDDTKKASEDLAQDSRVRYIYQENKGLSGARNTGIENATGDYIAFIDDDDIWQPEKIERQVRFFEASGDERIGMVFTHIALIDGAGKVVGDQRHFASGDIYKDLFFENVIDSPSSVLIKTEVIKTCGTFTESLKSCEDYELWFRIAKKYTIYSINELLVMYRVHQNKMSRKLEIMEFYQIRTLCKALSDAPNDISVTEDKIFNKSNQMFAVKYFLNGQYSECIRCYRTAKAYCPKISLDVHVKYLMSHFPGFMSLLKRIKRGFLK